MARFNATITEATETTNFAGGKAFSVDPRFELAAILLTSFVKDQHYRTGDATMNRLTELMKQVPPLFAAKAAVYARREHGLRSITHVAAAEIAKNTKGESWTKDFFRSVFYRPDDMLETFALYVSKYGKRPLPNALKKGARTALAGFDEYRLAKYRGDGKAFKMVDLVNLVHPKQTPAIAKLMKGELKNTATWEAQLTEAGKSEDVAEAKNQAWASLLAEKKLGYLALLRNLRNIRDQAPDVLDEALRQLADPGFVQKSKVFPFQFLTALAELSGDRKIVVALSKAIDASLANVPTFPGKTLVVLDTSGSMQTGTVGGKNSAAKVGSLFAAALYKANDADMMGFSDDATYLTLNPTDSLSSLAGSIEKGFRSGGTNFNAIFQRADKAYDRIVILSDMQGWMGGTMSGLYRRGGAPTKSFADYRKRFACTPKVYSFDLCAYGQMMFPEKSVFAIAGVSDKTFDLMRAMEEEPKALIRTIEAVQFVGN